MKYRLKGRDSAPVEAFQWSGGEGMIPYPKWHAEALQKKHVHYEHNYASVVWYTVMWVWQRDSRQWLVALKNDWIVNGPLEMTVEHPGFFKELYEEVPEEDVL